jgi:uridine phosphorylase
METFHLFHLASVWKPITRTTSSSSQGAQVQSALPSQDRPVRTTVPEGQLTTSLPDYSSDIVHIPESQIRAAAVQMVYAQRNSLDVIIPEDSDKLERWVGKAVLDCLSQVEVSVGDVLSSNTGLLVPILIPPESSCCTQKREASGNSRLT